MSNGKIDENMPYFRSGFFNLGGQKLYVSRTGFTNELGFEIFSDGLKTDHLALWDHVHNDSFCDNRLFHCWYKICNYHCFVTFNLPGP